MNLPQRNKAVAFLLFLIGCLQMTGYVLGIPAIQMAGRLTGAAPLPLVFNPTNGYEYWATRCQIQVIFRHGQQMDLNLDRKAVERINRPHLLKMKAILPLSVAPVANPAFLEEVLHSHLCRGWLLREAFDLHEPIRSATIVIKKPDGQQWRHSISCGQ